ncbi:S41 family peptidase [Flavobacterium sp.]|uniref:S41 family peptidase n=1 Tax=Flavobacterium sp. TaxID=239 RepID=UPI003340C72F
MRIPKIYIPILFFSCVALGIVIGGLVNYPIPAKATKQEYRSKLNRLLNFIENEYVDEVKTDSIVDVTVTGILANLDPHSVYVTPQEQTLLADNMRGDFVGIGINFYTYNDSIAVIKPIPGGPAEKAGIQAGDRILYAGKKPLFGKKLKSESLYNTLRGEPLSKIQLTVYRKKTRKTFTTQVVREVIPLKSVEVALLLDGNTGYIKIERFAETTGEEFHQALLQLKKEGMRALIIDVRENGGGVMESAIAIADELLPENDLIVFTKNKKGAVEKMYATEEGLFESGKVTVLIDENSASASEILAGAIQDNDRGQIVGRRSFGKGLVQREMNFDDGSAVRLTVARYFTPSGRSIQKPYKKGESEAYHGEYEHRYESGELTQNQKVKVVDSLKFKTKKGRTVYGGGGIVPDVFVPLESAVGEENVAYVLKTGIVGHFVFEQLDNNRSRFAGWTFEQFQKNYETTADFLPEFEKYMEKSGLQMQWEKSKSLVQRYVKAEFARQLFGDTAYYKFILQEDPMLKKAGVARIR